MKTYHSYQAECKQAETKLRLAEGQRLKLEQTLPRDKLDRSKKYRLIEKEVQKVNLCADKLNYSNVFLPILLYNKWVVTLLTIPTHLIITLVYFNY